MKSESAQVPSLFREFEAGMASHAISAALVCDGVIRFGLTNRIQTRIAVFFQRRWKGGLAKIVILLKVIGKTVWVCGTAVATILVVWYFDEGNL
jgi:hypothetical protein